MQIAPETITQFPLCECSTEKNSLKQLISVTKDERSVLFVSSRARSQPKPRDFDLLTNYDMETYNLSCASTAQDT